MYKSIIILIFSIVYFHLSLGVINAQSTGKIAGFVSDDQTGEPLVGVNVVVVGQFLGAATDIDGQYVILNVPPGEHTIQFEYIGYQGKNVTGTLVRIDRTTVVDAELSTQTLELDDVVTVTAERPIVENDKTFSSVHIDGADVMPLPVEGVRNILELSPGINKNADGTMSIRGGGPYEINYSINGITSMNTNTGVPAYGTGSKSENSWKYDINPLAISQMEVISGGFNAEYGNAQSGVVNVVTKDGGQDFNGAFFFEFRPAGQYHWGDYVYSQNQFEWQKWGDVAAWYPYFLNDSTGIVDTSEANRNYNLWKKNRTPSDDNIFGVYDYRKLAYTRYLFSFGGPLGRDGRTLNFFFSGEIKNTPTRLPTREKIQELTNLSLVLSFKPSAENNFRITGLYQKYLSGMGSGSNDVRWAGLWGQEGAKRKYTLVYDSPREETVFAQSLSYKHIFSSISFLEATLTHQSEVLFALQTPTPATETDIQDHPTDLENRQIENKGPWFEDYRQYFTWSSLYNQASETEFYEGRVIFTGQLSKTNLLKIGAEGYLMDQNYNASSSLSVSAFIWRTGFATNYKAKTWYVGSFVQDKLEFAGMVGNFGLRFDAYNFGADAPADIYNVFYPAEGSTSFGIPEWQPSETYTSFSPRIGISFPIGDRTAFRLQYGHFRSMPIINRALDNQTSFGWGSYGNPNLKPKLSINYEVGVQQNLWGTHQLDIVTYYNDLKDQISTVYVQSSTGKRRGEGLDYTYINYNNQGYGTSRGIEVTFANKTADRLKYRMSYSYSQTTFGNYGTYVNFPELSETQEERFSYSASDFLAPEDRSHRFNATFTYAIPEGEGLSMMGLRPFSNFTASVIYRVQSGAAYFFSPEYQTSFQVEPNRRYPMESTTDIRLEKGFTILGLNFKAGIRVLNLFDNKHLTPIYTTEELERWVLRSVTYADADYTSTADANRPFRLYNYFQTYRNIPRQVFFSLGFTF